MKETHFMQYKEQDVIIIEYNQMIFYSNGYETLVPWEVSYRFYEKFDKVPCIGDYFKGNFHFVITDIVSDNELFEDTSLANKYKFYKIHVDNLIEREAQMKIIEESLILYKEKHSIDLEFDFSPFDGLITDKNDILPRDFYKGVFYIYVLI